MNFLIKNFHHKKFVLTLALIFALAIQPVFSYNMRQSSNIDGLSNSAILSLCRDDNGFLWIGTCDGVNIADGTSINPFSSIFPGQPLSGNIIESIFNGGNGIMCVLTNHGLDIVDCNKRTVSTFPQFGGQELMCVNEAGTLFLLAEDSGVFYHDPKTSSNFVKAGKIDIPFDRVRRITMKNNSLWIVSDNGIYAYDIAATTKGVTLSGKTHAVNKTEILFAKVQGNKIFIIDKDGFICEITETGASNRIADISTEIKKRGRVSDLVNDHHGDFFVSFSTDGVIWVDVNGNRQFQAIDLHPQVGVFCLEQSSDQDVIWIGSDCQGLYTYWDDLYSIRSFDFNSFGNKFSHPIRAIHVDRHNNLWLGTKGGGILKVTDFNESDPYKSIANGMLFTSSNSDLQHNSVFALGESNRPIMWIATEEGLNYYNYKEGRIY